MMASGEWWHDFFPSFRALFNEVSQRETNAQVRYLVKKLGLKQGQKFLDCPCGIGRISIPLARRGIRVTGVDITSSYLDELQRKAKRVGLKIPTERSDMRRIKFENEFDAAGNLWTSFGFFEREADHLLTIKRMYQALKPGGIFVLHVINRDWIMVNYEPRSWYDIPGGRVLEDRSFDYERSISRAEWIFIRDGQERVHRTGIRMFSLHELLALFRAAGFEEITASGSTKDDPVERRSRMMWVFGTKPRR